MDGSPPTSTELLFRNPERFPPIGKDRPTDSAVDHTGLLTCSSELSKSQRAYVHVSQSGVVESVASNVGGTDQSIDLEKLTNFVVKFSQKYSISLAEAGFSPPTAILVSLVAASGLRLLQQLILGAFSVDMPQRTLSESTIHFGETTIEGIPSSLNETAKELRPILNVLANASGLASCPFFDADGNYTSKMRVGL